MRDAVPAEAPVVLAAVDDSCVARLVIIEARRLAASMRSALRVVHAVEPGTSVVTPWLAELRRGGIQVERVAGGPAWIAINREATASSAELLVVGSHGRSGYHPLTPGATTGKLLVTAPCPLVVVSARHAAAQAPDPSPEPLLEGDLA